MAAHLKALQEKSLCVCVFHTELSFNQGTVTAVQVVPAQLYSVVLAVPSVRKYSDPGPLGDVPQAAEGAPVPAEIDAPPYKRS